MSLLDRVRFLLLTGFGSGLAPFAPGTFGSVVGVAIGIGIELGVPGSSPWILWSISIVLLAYGCAESAFVERAFPSKDPGAVVLDEIIGQLVAAALFVSVCGRPLGLVGWALCFAEFRFFDIAKIQPAKRLEKIPGAPGIMLDDVAAGVWAGACVIALDLVGIVPLSE